jgi:ATP-dependent Clp protease ATP-binding subunit ClpC
VDNWDGESASEEAVFTFTGTRKPAEPAEADLAKAGAHAAGGPGTTAQ